MNQSCGWQLNLLLGKEFEKEFEKKFEKKFENNLELSEKVSIFATSECRQRARTICFHSNIQAGPF